MNQAYPKNPRLDKMESVTNCCTSQFLRIREMPLEKHRLLHQIMVPVKADRTVIVRQR